MIYSGCPAQSSYKKSLLTMDTSMGEPISSVLEKTSVFVITVSNVEKLYVQSISLNLNNFIVICVHVVFNLNYLFVTLDCSDENSTMYCNHLSMINKFCYFYV